MKPVTLNPSVGASDIHIGATREQIKKLLGTPKVFRKSQKSPNTTDDFAFCHVFYDPSNKCEAIELFEESQAIFNGVSVFEIPYSQLKETLKKADPSAIVEDDSIVAHNLGIATYAPGNVLSSIIIAKKDYFR